MANWFENILGLSTTDSSANATFTNPLSISGQGSPGAWGQASFKLNPLGDDSFVNLPEGIRTNRQNLFNQTLDLGQAVQGDIDALRSEENSFIRARVRPTQEKFAAIRSETEQGLARRGVTGTLATNELMRIDQAASREVADQTSKAQTEALNSILQRQDFQQSLQNSLRAYTQDEVAQALNELQFISGQAVTSFNTVQNSGQTVTGESQGDPSLGFGSLLETGVDLYSWLNSGSEGATYIDPDDHMGDTP
jgi:hypothetical protein